MDESPVFPAIIGGSQGLRNSLAKVRKVIPTDLPVLIHGESGTGKELVAQAIHGQGPRRTGPFIPVNAGAIPASLMESTLFGSKRGSFTGADVDRKGLFEAADGGTLFLDEISETTLEVQVRLLRVLQEGKILAVGATVERSVDVRIVAAANQRLQTRRESGHFRSDLYYRLAVVTIDLPPLRERLEDIEPLTNHFIDKHCRNLQRPLLSLTEEAVHKMRNYWWPGNVRELESVIQRAILFADTDQLTPDVITFDGSENASFPLTGLLEKTFREAQRGFEFAYFRALLARTGGDKRHAAEFAGLDRTTLYKYVKSIGLLDK